MKKILAVVPHFAPYRDDTFWYLQEKYGYELFILVTEGNISHPEWEYDVKDFRYINDNKRKRFGYLGYHYRALGKIINEFKPDIVMLHGELIELFYCRIKNRKTRLIFVADTSRPGKNAGALWNKIMLKFFYNLADGIYVPGKKACAYFRTYVNREKIRMGCYTDSVQRLKEKASRYKKKEIRKDYNIKEEAYIFLFVGKLIESRKVENILRLAGKIKNDCIHFIVVGDGPQDKLVKEYAQRKMNLTYIPSLNRDELEKVYVASDAYLYLGWEPYSLALYEAAIFAMPIIANKEIGACFDCLVHNKNGYAVTNETDEMLLDILKRTSEGEYQNGADEMALLIEKKRGIEWACRELVELIEKEK